MKRNERERELEEREIKRTNKRERKIGELMLFKMCAQFSAKYLV